MPDPNLQTLTHTTAGWNEAKIEVLTAECSPDVKRLVRLEPRSRMLTALNHSILAAIDDLEKSD